jgi:hypothetical protein
LDNVFILSGKVRKKNTMTRRWKTFLPTLLTVLTVLVLSFILYSILGTSDGTSESLLDLIGKQGIRLDAPFRKASCDFAEVTDEPGLYVCSDFTGPEGLLRIRLFTLDGKRIDAIELLMDPSRFPMSVLAREIKEDRPDYNLLFEEDSLVLFVSDTDVTNGPTYLLLKRNTSSYQACEELVLLLMTEKARRFFETPGYSSKNTS